MPTQMPPMERVFCSFWAPFGALHPLGDFPEKCHFGGFFLYVSLWELFAIPHMYILSSGLSWLLRFTCCSLLFRLYPSCSLVFVLFVSLLFFSLSSLVSGLLSRVSRLSSLSNFSSLVFRRSRLGWSLTNNNVSLSHPLQLQHQKQDSNPHT